MFLVVSTQYHQCMYVYHGIDMYDMYDMYESRWVWF